MGTKIGKCPVNQEPQYKILGKKKNVMKDKESLLRLDDKGGYANLPAIDSKAVGFSLLQAGQITKPKAGKFGDSSERTGNSRIDQSQSRSPKPNEKGRGMTKDRKTRVGHTMEVTTMLPLPKLQFLASAGLDKKIILWDLLENDIKREYKGYHKKGIVALDFSESLILLISAGFDHEIYVWNPYIEAPVHNLSGHMSPIIGLAFIENPLHIVSVDQDCVMKVWDTKKFKCVDTPTLENIEDKHSFKVNGICRTWHPNKIVLYGKNIYVFGYDKNNSLTSADENVSLCARFVAGSLCLMTPVGNKVKLWNLLTGEVKKIFSDLTKTDITSLVLDCKGKRFVMGDSEGNVGVYNVANGALLKTLTKHKAEIIFLIHAGNKLPPIGSTDSKAEANAKALEELKKVSPADAKAILISMAKQGTEMEYFISVSVDNQIKIHDDKELGESKLIASYPLKDGNITSLIYISEYNVGKLLIGSSNGVITFYETATGKCNEEFSDKDPDSGPEAEIMCLAFFTGYDTFIYANSLGYMKIVIVPPTQIKHEVLLRIVNTAPGSKVPSVVNNMAYCADRHLLFYTDDRFYIKCVDVSAVLKTVEEGRLVADKAKRVFIMTQDMIKPVWAKKVHEEAIRSLEYISEERLLVTTSMDKNVKIFYSDSGEFIESLRQNKNGVNKIKPIAYKKVESTEIYSPRMENRIDAPYVAAKEYRDNRIKEYLQKLENGQNPDFKPSDEIVIHLSEQPLEAFKEYEEQEFNPFYYTSKDYNRIDNHWLEQKRSNDWKLFIDFEKYFRNFQTQIKITKDEVKAKEEQLINQKEEEEKGHYVKATEAHTHPKAKAAIRSFKDKFISKTSQEDAKLRKQMEMENLKKKKKLQSNKFDDLYKSGLKSIVVKHSAFEMGKVRLSESERIAINNFANAFSKYDSDDPRVLRFTDYDERKPERKESATVNPASSKKTIKTVLPRLDRNSKVLRQ